MSDAAESQATPVSRVRIGVATHITPKASLTANESLQDFSEAIDDCVKGGELKIIADLSSAQTVDSLGITALMDAQDELLQKGGWLKITGHNNIIAEIATITGLSEYVTFLDSDGKRDLRGQPHGHRLESDFAPRLAHYPCGAEQHRDAK